MGSGESKEGEASMEVQNGESKETRRSMSVVEALATASAVAAGGALLYHASGSSTQNGESEETRRSKPVGKAVAIAGAVAAVAAGGALLHHASRSSTQNREEAINSLPNSDELFTVTLNSTTAITTTVTSSSSSVTAWLSALRSSSSPTTIVGLDIEWLPNNAYQENPASLLQLCVGNTCLIFQLLYADSIPSSMISFLKDPNYKFLGVGIGDDVEKLMYDHDLRVRNSVDLRDLAKEKTGRGEMKQMGIKRLAMEVLGIEFDKPKSISLSRWDRESLNPDQIRYATIDAYLSFEIGRRLYAMSSA